MIAASASPGVERPSRPPKLRTVPIPLSSSVEQEAAAKRSARIVRVSGEGPDERERLRQGLIERLLESEGRGAISRAADALLAAGFEFPATQEVQLQLLEHFDEQQAGLAIERLRLLLQSEPPIKRPIFEQRLRRLEEFAEEPKTRTAARDLRRSVRA